jgi:hypothetical protein
MAPMPVALGVQLPAVPKAPQRLGDLQLEQLLQVASNPEPKRLLQRVEGLGQLRQSGCSGGSVAHGVVSSALAGAVFWLVPNWRLRLFRISTTFATPPGSAAVWTHTVAEPKTKKNTASVPAFLDAIADEAKRKDAKAIAKLMRKITGEKPVMWGTSIVGYGSYRYRYASGREGDWPLTGFSPRAQNLTLYIMPGFAQYDALMTKLGKYSTGKSCLYLKRLADVDTQVLEELIDRSVAYMRSKYPAGGKA